MTIVAIAASAGTAAPYLRAISGFEALPAEARAATPAKIAANRKMAKNGNS